MSERTPTREELVALRDALRSKARIYKEDANIATSAEDRAEYVGRYFECKDAASCLSALLGKD